MDESQLNYTLAVRDFREARQRAALQEILAKLTGRSTSLLSYEQVRRDLRAGAASPRGLQEIPLDAVVGSVGRYTDFTRSFLPRNESDRDRWARVDAAVSSLQGLPPIEVYKIGEAYFVRDGHHRVSVARQLGAETIEAYVTEVETKVPLSPDAGPDELILMAEYARFLGHTEVDKRHPEADLRMTVPGSYDLLEEHIAVHRYFMGIERQSEIPMEEASAHWYEEVYLPVVQAIRGRGILRDFPGRTETDLYLWLSEHRAELAEELGWDVTMEDAATDLAEQRGSRPERIAARVGGRLRRAMIPKELEPGPSPGAWRERRSGRRFEEKLFHEILVAIRGEEGGWAALDQGLAVARLEGARLHGLHVAASPEQLEGAGARMLEQEFARRTQEAGVPDGALAFEVGEVASSLCMRSRWADLLVVSLAHPPSPRPVERLGSGFRALIRSCPRPVLAVPASATGLEHALLAYDGSPKAEEALFVAAYAAGRWGVPLTVLTVEGGGTQAEPTLARAREYLEAHGVRAGWVAGEGEVAEVVLSTAEARGCDWLLMGGYGASPVMEVILGSVVDQVLREASIPMLICR